MSTLTMGNFNMFYQEIGQGEPLFLVPGFSANHHMWDNILPLLTDTFRVIILDIRGGGLSSCPPGPYSVKQMADDIAALAKHLNITRAFFVGSSMGGAIVQTLAVDYPQLTKAIILANTFCQIDYRFQLFVDAVYQMQVSSTLPNKELARLFFAWVCSEDFVRTNLDTLDAYQAQDLPFTLEGYQGQRVALGTFDSSSWAHKITAPTFIMGGEDDLVVVPKHIFALAKQLPHARLYMFEQTGHLPSLEQPETFVDLVRDFLKDYCD